MRKKRLVIMSALVIAGLICLVWIGVAINPFRHAAVATNVDGFSFSISTNAFGDRILVHSPVEITYIPQSRSPDVVSITSSGGKLYGNFVWTIIPNQGGVRRVLGEYDIKGRVYKVCEYLFNPSEQAVGRAERYFVINNSGPKYKNPEPIDPTQFLEMFKAGQQEQARFKSNTPDQNTYGSAVTPEFARRSSALIGTCTGYRTPTPLRS